MDKRLLTSALDGICNRIPTLPEIPNSVKKNVLRILKEKSYFMLSAPPCPSLHCLSWGYKDMQVI